MENKFVDNLTEQERLKAQSEEPGRLKRDRQVARYSKYIPHEKYLEAAYLYCKEEYSWRSLLRKMLKFQFTHIRFIRLRGEYSQSIQKVKVILDTLREWWPFPFRPIRRPTPVPSVTATQALLDTHNQERAILGIAPLALNPSLNTSASEHSQDMATNNYLNHNGLDGSTPGQRMQKAGYIVRSTWGENIAEGQQTVAEVVTSWMGDAGHRDNILNPNFKDVGFGVSQSASGANYWTADFGG